MIDVGKSNSFNPVIDFLLPLYKKRNSAKSTTYPSKYKIDQIIISHPHRDHLSGIKDFNDNFYPDLLTCPNDNKGMPEDQLIDWDLIGNEKEEFIIVLKNMLSDRKPPLRPTSDQHQFIFYLPPQVVQNNSELNNESYCNNISIATFLIINEHRVFFPGDVQKLGMEALIAKNYPLRNKLKHGVDVLICPHHGLKSSFSTYMFDCIKGRKTNSLNIVSEKVNNPDDSRNVDSRYSSSEFCNGNNNLEGGNGVKECYQVKTSRGHIFIDYSIKPYPTFEIITDNQNLMSQLQN